MTQDFHEFGNSPIGDIIVSRSFQVSTAKGQEHCLIEPKNFILFVEDATLGAEDLIAPKHKDSEERQTGPAVVFRAGEDCEGKILFIVTRAHSSEAVGSRQALFS